MIERYKMYYAIIHTYISSTAGGAEPVMASYISAVTSFVTVFLVMGSITISSCLPSKLLTIKKKIQLQCVTCSIAPCNRPGPWHVLAGKGESLLIKKIMIIYFYERLHVGLEGGGCTKVCVHKGRVTHGEGCYYRDLLGSMCWVVLCMSARALF